jgi:hypothetical protein
MAKVTSREDAGGFTHARISSAGIVAATAAIAEAPRKPASSHPNLKSQLVAKCNTKGEKGHLHYKLANTFIFMECIQHSFYKNLREITAVEP